MLRSKRYVRKAQQPVKSLVGSLFEWNNKKWLVVGFQSGRAVIRQPLSNIYSEIDAKILISILEGGDA